MPEHYELMFTRQFAVGEHGDMMGLGFVIYVPAADELRDLKASLWGADSDAEIKRWLDEVEADPAFAVPMTRHSLERFAFGIDGIGLNPALEQFGPPLRSPVR